MAPRRTRGAARCIGAVLTALGISLLGWVGVAGGTSSTAPGTAAQVKALVAASSKITKVSAAVSAELANSSSLKTRTAYPSVGSGCMPPNPCVFGNAASSTAIVLFGDSHALMWLPAVIAAAATKHLKVDLFWAQTCPLVVIPGITFANDPLSSNCTTFRIAAIAQIKQIKPILVILGERTYEVYTTPGSVPISTKTWTTALQSTIRQIQTKHTKIVLVEDPIAFTGNPVLCVASYPNAIQGNCAVKNPNVHSPGHQTAEKQAALATKSTFVMTVPWFCKTTCSPVVGDNLVHFDQGHVSVPYAKYLSTVFTQAIRADL